MRLPVGLTSISAANWALSSMIRARMWAGMGTGWPEVGTEGERFAGDEDEDAGCGGVNGCLGFAAMPIWLRSQDATDMGSFINSARNHRVIWQIELVFHLRITTRYPLCRKNLKAR